MDPSHTHGVDAHCHLDHPSFDLDRNLVVDRALTVGIGQMVLAAGNPKDWARVRQVATDHGLAFALGVHPWWPDRGYLEALPDALRGACAIGETGLDYLRAKDKPARALQHELLQAHLQLAVARDLPVIFHAVRAVAPLLDAIANTPVRGMIHGFVRGDVDRALSMGLHLSFGPDVCRSPAALRSAVATPTHRLLLESDAPDRPLRGDRGEPGDVVAIARYLAPHRGTTPEALLQQTGDNARSLFALGAS